MIIERLKDFVNDSKTEIVRKNRAMIVAGSPIFIGIIIGLIIVGIMKILGL